MPNNCTWSPGRNTQNGKGEYHKITITTTAQHPQSNKHQSCTINPCQKLLNLLHQIYRQVRSKPKMNTYLNYLKRWSALHETMAIPLPSKSNTNWVSQSHEKKVNCWEGEGQGNPIPQVHFLNLKTLESTHYSPEKLFSMAFLIYQFACTDLWSLLPLLIQVWT